MLILKFQDCSTNELNARKKSEERYRNLQSKLEACEQKYEQVVKKSQSAMSNFDNDIMPKNIAIAQVTIYYMNIIISVKNFLNGFI